MHRLHYIILYYFISRAMHYFIRINELCHIMERTKLQQNDVNSERSTESIACSDHSTTFAKINYSAVGGQQNNCLL